MLHFYDPDLCHSDFFCIVRRFKTHLHNFKSKLTLGNNVINTNLQYVVFVMISWASYKRLNCSFDRSNPERQPAAKHPLKWSADIEVDAAVNRIDPLLLSFVGHSPVSLRWLRSAPGSLLVQDRKPFVRNCFIEWSVINLSQMRFVRMESAMWSKDFITKG